MLSGKFQILLAGLALPTTLIAATWTCQFVWLHLIFKSRLNRYLKRSTSTGSKTSWALVTGASDGIGFGFVQELAATGFNVILHGRNKTKLDGLIAKVQEQYPSQQFRSLIADASTRDDWNAIFQNFVTELKASDIDLRVLVNNVGGTGGNFFAFDRMVDRTHEAITKTIDVNVTFATTLTQAVLPYLIEKQPSLIINIGSAAACVPFPYLAVYAASKAFNMYWSDSLNIEMKLEKNEVEVLGVVTGRVLNASSGDLAESLFVPSSRGFARATLHKVGCGLINVNAFWAHDLQLSSLALMPTWLIARTMATRAVQEMADERKAR